MPLLLIRYPSLPPECGRENRMTVRVMATSTSWFLSLLYYAISGKLILTITSPR